MAYHTQHVSAIEIIRSLMIYGYFTWCISLPDIMSSEKPDSGQRHKLLDNMLFRWPDEWSVADWGGSRLDLVYDQTLTAVHWQVQLQQKCAAIEKDLEDLLKD